MILIKRIIGDIIIILKYCFGTSYLKNMVVGLVCFLQYMDFGSFPHPEKLILTQRLVKIDISQVSIIHFPTSFPFHKIFYIMWTLHVYWKDCFRARKDFSKCTRWDWTEFESLPLIYDVKELSRIASPGTNGRHEATIGQLGKRGQHEDVGCLRNRHGINLGRVFVYR